MNNSQNLMVNLKQCLSADNLKKITMVLKKLKGVKVQSAKTELNQVLDEIHMIFFSRKSSLCSTEQKRSDKSYAEKRVCIEQLLAIVPKDLKGHYKEFFVDVLAGK